MPRRGSLLRYMLALAVRNRMMGLLALFTLVLACASVTLTYLTPGTERRTFFDMAYLGLEILAVVTPIFASTSLQILEFDQRTCWLVLVRPVTRPGYVWGRFLGVAGAGWINVVMATMVFALLVGLMRGFPDPFFFPVIAAALMEAMVVGALVCLAAFVTTSYMTTLVVMSGVVMLGYLSPTLEYLATKSVNPALSAALRALYWILPHLAEFSVRDFAQAPEAWYIAYLGAYALAYTGAVLALAILVFRRREV